MQQEEYIDKGVKYVRIDKRKARIKFGEGKTICLIPDRMRLENAWVRQTKAIFSMDFQNDAQFVGGCIAGGRSLRRSEGTGE